VIHITIRIARRPIIVITARESKGRIVFSIVARFSFSVDTITHEPLQLGWWRFAWTCTSTNL